jgi:hypothetical protein
MNAGVQITLSRARTLVSGTTFGNSLEEKALAKLQHGILNAFVSTIPLGAFSCLDV